MSVPADWAGKFGDCVVYRDVNTFKEAPASLCVEASGKSGQAFHAFPVTRCRHQPSRDVALGGNLRGVERHVPVGLLGG